MKKPASALPQTEASNELTSDIETPFPGEHCRPSDGLPRRFQPRCRGLSYAEVAVSVIIVSVLLVAALRLFGDLGRARLNTLDRDAGATLALEMIQEIKQQYYNDPDGSPVFGPEADEVATTRNAFDDVDDYHNWTATPPQARDGTQVDNHQNMTRSVEVRRVAANDFAQSAVADQSFKEVVITVKSGDQEISQQVYVIANTDYEKRVQSH